MKSPQYTSEEVIEALKRTSTKTVVVEGKDDAEILRQLEDQLLRRCGDMTIFPVGGRDIVLESSESFKDSTESIAFLADSDVWLYTDDRTRYANVIFTDGYSIENICSKSDQVRGLVENRSSTMKVWLQALETITVWFKSEIAYFLSDQAYSFRTGSDCIEFSSANANLNSNYFDRINSAPPLPTWIAEQIDADPHKHVRGKNLLLTIIETLSSAEGVKFSVKSLHSIGSKLENRHLEQLVNQIVRRLNNEPQKPA